MKRFVIILAFPIVFASHHAFALEMMPDPALHEIAGQAGIALYIDGMIMTFWVDAEKYINMDNIYGIPSGIEMMPGGVFRPLGPAAGIDRRSLLREMMAYNAGENVNALIGVTTVEIMILPERYTVLNERADTSNGVTISSDDDDEVVSVQHRLSGRMEMARR